MHDTTGLPRAVQVFTLDDERPGSPIAERVWRTRSEPVDCFTSVAAPHWEMVVTRHEGRTSLTVRWPETKATVSPVPREADFFGIEFRLGTFMPDLPVGQLVDGALTLPNAGDRSFWMNGSVWELPTFDNADVFLRRLVRRGRVMRDLIVESVLHGQPVNLSSRSIRRRIRRTTGLTLALVKQIERAHHAIALLESGVRILDVVERMGYADQSHLTRSLRRFEGHTPAQVASMKVPRPSHGRSRSSRS